MKTKIFFLLILLAPFQCFANEKSGISLTFSGSQGVNWDIEYFWHNPDQDPAHVIYIDQNTDIIMSHNGDNIVQVGDDEETVSAPSEYPGTIRYKVDRDYQLGEGTNEAYGKYWWAAVGGHAAYPAYSSPFALEDLTYGTGYSDDSNSQTILGGVGYFGTPYTDRNDYYYGFIGPYEDEWHTIEVADDDTAYHTNRIGGTPTGSQIDFTASDHKVYLFVVNPKTPCLKMSGIGKWYTTPAKVWWVPKIHEQTSYIDSNVNIRLSNITNSNTIYFRLYQTGQTAPNFSAYTTAAMDSAVLGMSDSVEYTMEYYFNSQYVKSRRIYKNPPFPSENEAHGYRFWGTQVRAEAVKTSFFDSGNLGLEYSNMKKKLDDSPKYSDGKRTRNEKTGEYALVAWADGLDAEKDHANASKHYLLDNVFNMEIVFLQYDQNRPNPSPETYDSGNTGYRCIKVYLQQLLAYDLLISFYKSTDDPDGITPIEDYKIRDNMAKHVVYALWNLGEYATWPAAQHNSGMWAGTSEFYAAICSHILPSYSTPYYGTSGFDGNTEVYPYTPYPDQSLTWKDAFYDQNTSPSGSFPNLVRHFTAADQIITSAGSCNSLPAGHFRDRVGYWSPTLYGIPPAVYSSYIGMNGLSGPDIEYLHMAFKYANNGSGGIYGVKDCSGPRTYNQIIIRNAGHQELYEFVSTGDLEYELYRQRPWGLIYYDPDYDLSSIPLPPSNLHIVLGGIVIEFLPQLHS